MFLRSWIILIFLWGSFSTLSAESTNEMLLQNLPQGYQIGYQKRHGKIMMIEMVPKGETVEEWSQMVTATIAYGGIGEDIEDYYEKVSGLWKSACAGSDAMLLKEGEDNGYDYAMWALECQKNRSTNRSEMAIFKAIEGKDSFYIVQKAWRGFAPKKEDIAVWMAYLEGVRVCNNQDDDHPCK